MPGRHAFTGLMLCLLVAVLVGALWTLTYKNATKPATVCTHGESSIAVSFFHGHVKIIRPETKTGCAP